MVECSVCSDFTILETSKLSRQIGGINYDEIINQILENKIEDKSILKKVDLDKILKNSNYKKLSLKDKDLVYNTINHHQENKKEYKENKRIKINANTFCNNCNNKEDLKPQTLIYKSIINKKIDFGLSNDNKYDLIELDNTLPRTTNYNCPNDKCDTKKNPNKKEAIIYRENYKMTYKCVICKTIWN